MIIRYKDCFNYDESESYPGTGYCNLWSDYMGEDEGCADYEEVEE